MSTRPDSRLGDLIRQVNDPARDPDTEMVHAAEKARARIAHLLDLLCDAGVGTGAGVRVDTRRYTLRVDDPAANLDPAQRRAAAHLLLDGRDLLDPLMPARRLAQAVDDLRPMATRFAERAARGFLQDYPRHGDRDPSLVKRLEGSLGDAVDDVSTTVSEIDQASGGRLATWMHNRALQLRPVRVAATVVATSASELLTRSKYMGLILMPIAGITTITVAEVAGVLVGAGGVALYGVSRMIEARRNLDHDNREARARLAPDRRRRAIDQLAGLAEPTIAGDASAPGARSAGVRSTAPHLARDLAG